jgi:hypothetical protein
MGCTSKGGVVGGSAEISIAQEKKWDYINEAAW